ncbi:threonine aldolase [Halobacteriovorax marinus]|uniref:Threonine aldolase n=1 Tax=Halobacteriovorax marinus TaxID=97084 RepID=A0A1Y5F9Y2_9BACT|nr:threonine aldolase [Halobacteriovorax marinus]
MIDLRSDTVTKPSAAMLEAMMNAEVGDDVFGEDPSINKLQEKAAAMFNMEAALFCPSGTMTNQIALTTHVQSMEEIIVEKDSHIYQYEGGGIFHNTRASVKLVDGINGKMTAAQVVAAINPDDIHKPISKLVSLENTTNRGGGGTYSLSELQEISKICKEKELILHLDGARVFNAFIKEGYGPSDLGPIFDSISICLSKGLGCPVGSLLLGSKAFIRKSLRVRKVFGGGMRQAGFLAAAGIYALDNNIERLRDDHQLAMQFKDILNELSYVSNVVPVQTNIVIFNLKENIDPFKFLDYLSEAGVKAVSFGGQAIRFVTHMDFKEDMIKEVKKVLESFNP